MAGLASAASNFPHATYSSSQKSLQEEWKCAQGVTKYIEAPTIEMKTVVSF
jgi:hypothetical protein